eukprot:3269-Heterococcus_DN1.PRE.2
MRVEHVFTSRYVKKVVPYSMSERTTLSITAIASSIAKKRDIRSTKRHLRTCITCSLRMHILRPKPAISYSLSHRSLLRYCHYCAARTLLVSMQRAATPTCYCYCAATACELYCF